jgi:hypothetical protein
MVRLEASSLLRFEREPTAIPEPYGTGPDGTRGTGLGAGPFVLIVRLGQAVNSVCGFQAVNSVISWLTMTRIRTVSQRGQYQQSNSVR